jgi:NAD(P)-dependent dehydrogenase (short-subunit alcohol dehydrogenase family)
MGERRPIDQRLDDAVVVVTGAAQGIGAAVALAAVAHGAHVAVVDRDESGLARTVDDLRAVDPSRQVVSGVLDVRDDTAVHTWFGEVAARLGPIDVLVNNAGGGFAAPFLEVSEKGQDALVRENFSSVASCIRAVAPHLPPPTSGRGGGGSIITITSIEARRARLRLTRP